MGDDSGAIARSPVIGRILSPVCRIGGGGGGGSGGGGGRGGGNCSRGGSARSQASSYFSPTGGLEDGLLSSEERAALRDEESLPLSSSYKVEVIEIFKLSLPVAVATLCRLAIFTTDSAFLGHLGTDELGGSTLAETFRNFLGVFVFSSAYVLNALCSQAIGSGQNEVAGVWLNVSLMACVILCVPITVLFFFTENVLRVVATSDKGLLDYAGKFNDFAGLFFAPMVIFMALRQFFQALQIVMPATIVCFISVFFNIAANQVLIHGVGSWEGLGFIGSPLATALSFLFQITVFSAYAFGYKAYHRPYWRGFTTAGFTRKRLLTFASLVVPMTLGNAIENWGYQISTLASGNMGSVAVASMSIMYKIWGLMWAFYWGFGLALQVRIGKHLGSGNAPAAKRVVVVSGVLVATVVSVVSLVVHELRFEIIRIFTSDPEVTKIVGDTFWILSIDFVAGCFTMASMNILEGMSRNNVMACIQVGGTWLIMVPASVYLGLYSGFFGNGDERIKGFWLGSLAGETIKSCVGWLVVILLTDWEKQARLARERNETEMEEQEEEEDDKNGNDQVYYDGNSNNNNNNNNYNNNYNNYNMNKSKSSTAREHFAVDPCATKDHRVVDASSLGCSGNAHGSEGAAATGSINSNSNGNINGNINGNSNGNSYGNSYGNCDRSVDSRESLFNTRSREAEQEERERERRSARRRWF